MGTRVVFDTNVLVSALGWDGKPEDCLELVFDNSIDAYSSPDIIDELSRVLEYDRLGLTPDERQSFLEIVVTEFHVVRPDPDLDIDAVDDPDDSVFLECAVSVDVDYVISGDRHLLDLTEYDGIPILTPDDFLKRDV